MRIVLQNENRKERRLYVPNVLLLNHLSVFWISKGLERHGIQLPIGQIRHLKKQLQSICRQHPDWVLLEAEDVSGEKIKITI